MLSMLATFLVDPSPIDLIIYDNYKSRSSTTCVGHAFGGAVG